MGVCTELTTDTRRALVVRGGWEGHQPVTITELFLPLLKEQGFTVELSDTLAVYEDADLLAGTDLIVQCWTMGTLTPEQSEGLAGAVRAGSGLAGWHGGIVDAFRGDLRYQLLTGGQFLMHPRGFHDHEVRIVPERAGHPVVAGLDTFRVHTEQYWVGTDPLNDVLATTTFEATEPASGGPAASTPPGMPSAPSTATGQSGPSRRSGQPGTSPEARAALPLQQRVVMPAVWTRSWGAGKVFVSTIGHKPDDFDVPEVRALTERGLLWASR